MTIFEQSKSDAQRGPMFPATVIAAPGAEDPVDAGLRNDRQSMGFNDDARGV